LQVARPVEFWVGFVLRQRARPPGKAPLHVDNCRIPAMPGSFGNIFEWLRFAAAAAPSRKRRRASKSIDLRRGCDLSHSF
jgi:hypothetical protein